MSIGEKLPAAVLIATSSRYGTDYIRFLPKGESRLPEWRTAMEVLMPCGRGGPTMSARMAFPKALNRNVVLEFNPDARQHRWGTRKRKRDQ